MQVKRIKANRRKAELDFQYPSTLGTCLICKINSHIVHLGRKENCVAGLLQATSNCNLKSKLGNYHVYCCGCQLFQYICSSLRACTQGQKEVGYICGCWFHVYSSLYDFMSFFVQNLLEIKQCQTVGPMSQVVVPLNPRICVGHLCMVSKHTCLMQSPVQLPYSVHNL